MPIRNAAVLALLLLAAPSELAAQAAGELSLDRLYSLPSLAGTAPAGVVWSPDGTRLAFLWNDQGMPFRDVWMVGVDGSAPLRLTAFPRPQPGGDAGGGGDIATLLANARIEIAGGVSAVAWFPDGNSLLLTLDGRHYRLVPGEAPEPLEARLGGQPVFSPDGRWLAHTGGGGIRIAALTADGVGDDVGIAESPTTGVSYGGLRWSPDSARIAAFLRDSSGVAERLIPDYLGEETTAPAVRRPLPGEEPGRTRLVVFDLDTRVRRDMNTGDDNRDPIFTVEWSPDSRRLLVDTSDLYVKNRRLLALDATTGEATVLVREDNPANVMAFWQAAWDSDGRSALFLSDHDGFYHVYRVEPGSAPTPLTRGNWEVESFHPTPDTLYVVTNRLDPSQRHLERVPIDGGEPVQLSRLPGTHAPILSPDSRRVADLLSSDGVPPDLFLNALDGRGEARLTTSPLPEFAGHRWVMPRYVTFPSHLDGVTVHGRLMLPPDFDPARRYPAIIGSIYSNTLRNQWGGRNAHPLWGLDQYLVSRGYVLLNVNIRGSWGFGRAFRDPLRLDYGGIDTEDIFSGVEYLRSLGNIDMERVGLWGSSYGGLMTAMSLFKRPGVFAAGVAGAPATNVWHALTGEMRVMGRPQDHPDAYARSSAVTWAEGLEDPLMIIHGMQDRIVQFKDSLVLLEKLMLVGKADLLDLVALPGAGHGWDTGPLHQTRYAFRQLVAHFDRYLAAGAGQR